MKKYVLTLAEVTVEGIPAKSASVDFTDYFLDAVKRNATAAHKMLVEMVLALDARLEEPR